MRRERNVKRHSLRPCHHMHCLENLVLWLFLCYLLLRFVLILTYPAFRNQGRIIMFSKQNWAFQCKLPILLQRNVSNILLLVFCLDIIHRLVHCGRVTCARPTQSSWGPIGIFYWNCPYKISYFLTIVGNAFGHFRKVGDVATLWLISLLLHYVLPATVLAFSSLLTALLEYVSDEHMKGPSVSWKQRMEEEEANWAKTRNANFEGFISSQKTPDISSKYSSQCWRNHRPVTLGSFYYE